MPRFRYTARRSAAHLERGVLEAESPEAASRTLAGRGLFPLQVEPDDASTGSVLHRRRRRLPVATQALLARQLADLLEGGLTVDGALGVLVEQRDADASLAAELEELRSRVRAGQPLSAALESSAHLFPAHVAGSVRAGEASGALASVLHHVAELLEREAQVGARIREALLYPAVVAGVALLTLGVLFGFVVPRVAALYRDLDQMLPWPTRVLLFSSALWVRGGWAVLPVGALGAWGLRERVRRTPSWRLRLDTRLLRLPVIGPILLRRELVRAARGLATLVTGGVPLVGALELLERSAGNRAFAASLAVVRGRVRDGQSLADAVAAEPLLAASLATMLRVGEASGNYAPALLHLAQLHERDLDARLKRLVTLLEPLLVVVVGALVAFIVFALMLPILQVDLGI